MGAGEGRGGVGFCLRGILSTFQNTWGILSYLSRGENQSGAKTANRGGWRDRDRGIERKERTKGQKGEKKQNFS